MPPMIASPGVSRAATGRALRMVEQMLEANGVTRVRDLPEEARVRLYRRVASFLDAERTARWEREMRGGWWRRMTHSMAGHFAPRR